MTTDTSAAAVEAVLRFCEERAASYGALRASALTAVALDQAMALIRALAPTAEKGEQADA